MADSNHPIAIASRLLESSIRAQRDRGGPDYRPWEDDLAPAIERLAFAVVDEVVQRLGAQGKVPDELPSAYLVWRICPGCGGVGKVRSSLGGVVVVCARCHGSEGIWEPVSAEDLRRMNLR